MTSHVLCSSCTCILHHRLSSFCFHSLSTLIISLRTWWGIIVIYDISNFASFITNSPKLLIFWYFTCQRSLCMPVFILVSALCSLCELITIRTLFSCYTHHFLSVWWGIIVIYESSFLTHIFCAAFAIWYEGLALFRYALWIRKRRQANGHIEM